MRLSFVLNLLLLLVSSLVHKAWAQVVAPSKGGYVKLETITATTAQLSFGGEGQGRVIALAASPKAIPVPLSAINNNFYNGDSIYSKGTKIGQGYTVYSGPKQSITIAGLKPNTTYFVTNAEYNTDGQNIMYNTQGTSTFITTRDAQVATPQPLPVELVNFTGRVSNQNCAALNWTTATEHNSSYFALERSVGNQDFIEVDRLAAAGNSFQTRTYTWSDTRPLDSKTYYRLRQVDQNGANNYSSVVVLSPYKMIISTMDIFPNPSSGQAVQLRLQGFNGKNINLNIYDNLGRIIFNHAIRPDSIELLLPIQPSQSFTCGTYIIDIATTDTHIRKQLIISR